MAAIGYQFRVLRMPLTRELIGSNTKEPGQGSRESDSRGVDAVLSGPWHPMVSANVPYPVSSEVGSRGCPPWADLGHSRLLDRPTSPSA
jgi:hypothetical protein